MRKSVTTREGKCIQVLVQTCLGTELDDNSIAAADDTLDYVGCFREDKHARVFAVSPGDYDPASLNPEVCLRRCNQLDFPYSGLTSSSFCFCANQLPATRGVDEDCSEVCSDMSNATLCGGFDHVSVYRVKRNIRDLTIRPIGSETMMAFEPREFRIDVDNSTNASFHYKYVLF